MRTHTHTHMYIARILQQVLAGSQNTKDSENFLLSYLIYCQIWLNLLVNAATSVQIQRKHQIDTKATQRCSTQIDEPSTIRDFIFIFIFHFCDIKNLGFFFTQKITKNSWNHTREIFILKKKTKNFPTF